MFKKIINALQWPTAVQKISSTGSYCEKMAMPILNAAMSNYIGAGCKKPTYFKSSIMLQ